ncbi:PREDICTED: uncharacterized protein LOC104757066 [Camelina sativa]|uniref:Uncharacterized protein LOC104757066 n=1 Tax=Camelina sativa TaxID=90675 RepID=A0ABM0WYR3_CAMSA|nr:PREDICTED: uncharacterized protein LOC104757066 [Camelina sativa]
MLSSSPAVITAAHPPPSSETYQIPLSSPSPQIITRRDLFKTLSVCIATPSSLTVAPANARGLFQMPPLRLSNRYYLVRAGESDYESLGIINTNPVAKTSVDSGLSDKGKKQTVRAALQLKAMGACDRNCWLWPSITQRAYQAAEIIASINGISRRGKIVISIQDYSNVVSYRFTRFKFRNEPIIKTGMCGSQLWLCFVSLKTRRTRDTV